MKLTRFLVWCKKAFTEEKTEIEPVVLEMSDYDILVFGSPVWAFKLTSVIDTVSIPSKDVKERKCGWIFNAWRQSLQTDEIFRKWIESRGMKLVAVTSIPQKDIENEKKTLEIVSFITSIK